AELVRVHPGMDWERVMAQARGLRSERRLFLGLGLASDLLGANLPEAVLQRVQADHVVGTLAAQVRKQLFAEPATIVKFVESTVLHLRTMQGGRSRISYILYHLRPMMTPNAKDLAFFPLPTALSFLYYVLRPIRLMREYGRVLWYHLLRVVL